MSRNPQVIPDPSYVASPELPQTDKTGEQLYHEGYRRISSRYQILTAPPPQGADLLAIIQKEHPQTHKWLVQFVTRQVVETYFRSGAPKIGATYQQFMDFRKAERKRERNYMDLIGYKPPTFDYEALSHAPQSFAYEPPQLLQALKNIGYDLTCGQCASVFYTGVGTYQHDPTCFTEKKAGVIVQTPAEKCTCPHPLDLHGPNGCFGKASNPNFFGDTCPCKARGDL